MPALTNPVAGPFALPALAAPPSLLAPGVPSLAVFVDLMTGRLALAVAKGVPAVPERQADADGGKDLPDKDKQVDPALAWLFGPMPPAPPIDSRPVSTPVIGTSGGPAMPPVKTVTPAAVGFDPVINVVAPSDPLPIPDGREKAVVVDGSVPIAAVLPVDPDPKTGPTARHLPPAEPPVTARSATPALPLAAERRADGLRPQALTPRIVPLARAPQPLTVASAMPTSGAQPALFVLAMTERQPDDAKPVPTAIDTLRAIATTPAALTGDAQRQSFDMGDRDWPQKMIDRIEALRDHADAADTSIRLKPEALGRVDVALKSHADGAISVHFTAEQPATRTLLIDAAPQLTATAEARGIRLSGTSVDLGGQSEQRARPDVDRREPITNRVAPPGDAPDAVADGRVA